jgi:hypothetical protein
MTDGTQTHTIVRSYHDAWVAGDISLAATFLADNFVNFTSINNYYTVADYLESLRTFRRFMTSLDLLSELYGDAEATLIYDAHLALPVGTSRIAEHFKLSDGKIASIITIFDATVWRAMKG